MAKLVKFCLLLPILIILSIILFPKFIKSENLRKDNDIVVDAPTTTVPTIPTVQSTHPGSKSPIPASASKKSPNNAGRGQSENVLHKNLLFVSTLSGTLHCIDTRTGKPLWSRKDENSKPLTIHGQPLADSKEIYKNIGVMVPNPQNGEIFIVDTSNGNKGENSSSSSSSEYVIKSPTCSVQSLVDRCPIQNSKYFTILESSKKDNWMDLNIKTGEELTGKKDPMCEEERFFDDTDNQNHRAHDLNEFDDHNVIDLDHDVDYETTLDLDVLDSPVPDTAIAPISQALTNQPFDLQESPNIMSLIRADYILQYKARASMKYKVNQHEYSKGDTIWNITYSQYQIMDMYPENFNQQYFFDDKFLIATDKSDGKFLWNSRFDSNIVNLFTWSKKYAAMLKVPSTQLNHETVTQLLSSGQTSLKLDVPLTAPNSGQKDLATAPLALNGIEVTQVINLEALPNEKGIYNHNNGETPLFCSIVHVGPKTIIKKLEHHPVTSDSEYDVLAGLGLSRTKTMDKMDDTPSSPKMIRRNSVVRFDLGGNETAFPHEEIRLEKNRQTIDVTASVELLAQLSNFAPSTRPKSPERSVERTGKRTNFIGRTAKFDLAGGIPNNQERRDRRLSSSSIKYGPIRESYFTSIREENTSSASNSVFSNAPSVPTAPRFSKSGPFARASFRDRSLSSSTKSNRLSFSANRVSIGGSSELQVSQEFLKEMTYRDPAFRRRNFRLVSLFRKVLLVIRVTLICKKLISHRATNKKQRNKSFIEHITEINDGISLDFGNEERVLKRRQSMAIAGMAPASYGVPGRDPTPTQEECDLGVFNVQRFKKPKKRFVLHKQLRTLLCLPKQERFFPEIKEIQGILEYTFTNNNCQWTSWPRKVRDEICKHLSYQHVETGRTVIKCGHISYNYYLLFSGSVRVNIPIIKSDDIFYNTGKFKDGENEVEYLLRQPNNSRHRDFLEESGQVEWKTVAELNAGQGFGELGLFNKEQPYRNADVITSSDTELLVLSKEDFENVLMPIMKAQLYESYKFCQKHPLFLGSNISISEFHECALKSLGQINDKRRDPKDDYSVHSSTFSSRSQSRATSRATSARSHVSRGTSALSNITNNSNMTTPMSSGSKHTGPEYKFKYYAKNEQIHLDQGDTLIVYSGTVNIVTCFSENDRQLLNFNKEKRRPRILQRRNTYASKTSSVRDQEKKLNEVDRSRVRSAAPAGRIEKTNNQNMQNKESCIESPMKLNIATLTSGNVYGLTDHYNNYIHQIYPGETFLISDSSECITFTKRFFNEKVLRSSNNWPHINYTPTNLNPDFTNSRLEQNPACEREELLKAVRVQENWEKYKRRVVKDVVRRSESRAVKQRALCRAKTAMAWR